MDAIQISNFIDERLERKRFLLRERENDIDLSFSLCNREVRTNPVLF